MSKEKERTMFRVCKNKDNPYVMLNKEFLSDERLSWKAKGILGYLLSLPDDWQIYQTELVKHSADGIKSLASGLKELENYGYLKKEYLRNEKGQFIGYNYSVYEVPTETPKAENGKRHTTNNNITNNNISNSQSVSQSSGDIDGQTDHDINFLDELEEYKKNNPDDTGLLENIIHIFENMLKKDYIIINGQKLTEKEIYFILLKIKFENILQVLESYKKAATTKKIKNYTRYIETMFINSILENELKNKNNNISNGSAAAPEKNKKYKNSFNNFEGRNYTPDDIEKIKNGLLKRSLNS